MQVCMGRIVDKVLQVERENTVLVYVRLIGRLFFKSVISDHFPCGDGHFSFTTLCIT